MMTRIIFMVTAAATFRPGQGADRDRVGAGIRLPRDRHRLPAGDLPIVFAPRNRHLDARRPRGVAAGRGGAVVAAAGRCRAAGPGPAAGGVGALGGGSAGEPPLVPRAGLLPLPAREPVVAPPPPPPPPPPHAGGGVGRGGGGGARAGPPRRRG